MTGPRCRARCRLRSGPRRWAHPPSSRLQGPRTGQRSSPRRGPSPMPRSRGCSTTETSSSHACSVSSTRTTGPLSAPASVTVSEWFGMGVAGGSGPVHSPHLRRRLGPAVPTAYVPAGGRRAMPSIPNPIDIIGQGLGGSLADLAESAFNQAMKGLWDFSLSLLKGVLGVIDHLTLPNLDPATGPLSTVMPATIWVGGHHRRQRPGRWVQVGKGQVVDDPEDALE